MFSKIERTLAFRYLRSRKQTGFVSVISAFSFLGIMLGVATLIIVISVMNGFKSELMGRVLGINGHLGAYPATGAYLSDYKALEEKIQKLPAVQQVFPVVDGQAMASTNSYAQGVMVRGIDKESFKKRPILFSNYKGGDLSLFNEGMVILGYRLAQKMNLRSGDKITLVSPKSNITAFGSVPRMKTFQVIGVFDTKMFEYDANFIFMPLTDAQNFFGAKGKVSHLEIFTTDIQAVPSVLENAFNVTPPTVQLYDWRYTNQAFFNAIEVERNVMFLILTLIIIVASFNMISGLIMLVQDKKKDIAVLRTMGMSRGGILRIFLLSGVTIGILGTLAGVGLGLAFCYNIDAIKEFLEGLSGKELFSAEIYFLSHLPAEVNLNEVILIGVMSLSLSFLATLYPAWKAGKTDPVEVLRYE